VTHRERSTPRERDRPRYPSNTKLLGPQDRTGYFGEDKTVVCARESNIIQYDALYVLYISSMSKL
jgi:hypothetical protein